MKTQIVNLKTNYITLGRPGEYNVDEIIFDISSWVNAYGPDGHVMLQFKKPNGCMDIKKLNFDKTERQAHWILSKDDNTPTGTGTAQLAYIMDNAVKKSHVYNVIINDAISNEYTETQKYNDNIIDLLTEIKALLENNNK